MHLGRDPFVTHRPRPAGVPARLAHLTDRDHAATLTIGEATVKTYVNRLFAKLRLRDRVQAVVLAYGTGLVTPTGHRPP